MRHTRGCRAHSPFHWLTYTRVPCIPSISEKDHMARKLILSILVMALVIVAVLLLVRVVASRLNTEGSPRRYALTTSSRCFTSSEGT